MKMTLTNLWDVYGGTIKYLACCCGIGVLAACIKAVGRHEGMAELARGIEVIAEKTPDLTFGEFSSQMENKTFDTEVYKK